MEASRRRTYVIVTCILLLISFFLPWLDIAGITVSAWGLLRSGASLPGILYFLWIVPAVALILLTLQLTQSKERGLLYFLPFLTLLILFLWAYINAAGDGSTSVDDEDPTAQIRINSRTMFMELLAYGFWMAGILSLVLLFLGLRRRSSGD